MNDLIYTPIARIFYRGEVVAYRLQNQQGKIIDYTPQQFYEAAKVGMVNNCKAKGSLGIFNLFKR